MGLKYPYFRLRKITLTMQSKISKYIESFVHLGEILADPNKFSSISHGIPARCTGIMALVLEFIFFSINDGSIFILSGLISTNTGFAPTLTMTFAVEANVIGVVITSSPVPIPRVSRLRCNPAVQEFTALAYLEPI